MVLVCGEARFTGKHETEHGSHYGPMILRRAKQEKIEKCGGQTREEIRLSRQMLRKFSEYHPLVAKSGKQSRKCSRGKLTLFKACISALSLPLLWK